MGVLSIPPLPHFVTGFESPRTDPDTSMRFFTFKKETPYAVFTWDHEPLFNFE